jgi:hypothetical protein
MANLNVLFDYLIHHHIFRENNVHDIQSLLDNFSNITTELQRDSFINDEFYNFYKDMYNNKNNIIKFLDNLFNPYQNGFKLIELNKYNHTPEDNYEVWFSNEYITIGRTNLDYLKF